MSEGHWDQMARHWRVVGPPLRPSRADLVCFERALTGAPAGADRPMRAMVFGVTPELTALPWPDGAILEVLDASREMIDALWRGPKERGLVGSWTDTGKADAIVDVIVCDGGFGLLEYPRAQAALLAEVTRILAPGGLFIVRLLAPGSRAEPLERIAADLDAGAIPSLDALKLRLWGAMQPDPATGVLPREVVATMERIAGGLPRLTERLGWPAEHVATLEFNRNSRARYWWCGVDELRGLVEQAPGLEIVRVEVPEHAFGAKTPVVTLRRACPSGPR